MRDTAHKSLPTQKNTKLYGRHILPYNLVFVWCFNLQNGRLRKVTIHIFECNKTPQYRAFQHFRLRYGGDKLLLEKEILYSLGELSAEKPFVVTWMAWGALPHRGISYVDEIGTTRYFSIIMSGEDGSLHLDEFTNE